MGAMLRSGIFGRNPKVPAVPAFLSPEKALPAMG
jgi:hypothetical protein